MRIFLLPISTRRALIYCQRVSPKPTIELSYVDRITRKASDTWSSWEAAKSGWKQKVTEYGNKALQRIPYEEWGLKSFPPLNQQVQAEELTEHKKFPVFFPENIIQRDDVPKIMARLAKERKNFHYNRFWGCAIGMPLTLPFALVPIIPNIPFFYLTFRCWSHWRALKGSDHLDFILDHRLFRPVPSSEMEIIYEEAAPQHQNSYAFVTREQVLGGTDPEEHLLLKESGHKIVSGALRVPELGAEVQRAVQQVEQSLRKEKEQEDAKHQLEARKVEEEKQHKQ